MGAIDKKISELEELTTPAVNDLLVIVDVSIAGYETRNITVEDFVTGGIVAPADAQYVTLAVDADLTNERVLTGTANQVIVTDGGAGGAVTLSLPSNIILNGPASITTDAGNLTLDSAGNYVQVDNVSYFTERVNIGSDPDTTTNRWLDIDGTIPVDANAFGAIITPSLGFDNRSLFSIWTRCDIDAGITASESIGLFINDTTLGLGATVATQYQILIYEPTKGATNWGIYSRGGPNAFAGTISLGFLGASASILEVRQDDVAGAIPVLILDQRDVSEQAIVISYNSADIDMILLELDVTGNPQINWDEAGDIFSFTKGINVNGNITVTGTVDGVDIAGANSASYVVIGASADLANERILIGTANQITVTDGGAGGNVTISLPSDINLTGASSIGTTAGALTLDPVTQVLIPNNLFIDGSADEIQLRVQAVGGQTANIWTIEDSAGNVLAGADERGILFSDGGIDSDSVYIGNNVGNIAHTNAVRNVAIGDDCLRLISTGDDNVAVGWGAGEDLTSAYGVTLVGSQCGLNISTGRYNVAVGCQSLNLVTTQQYNTAVGAFALRDCIGENNAAFGYQSLRDTTTGTSNMGIGTLSLFQNLTGSYNTGIGGNTLRAQTTGDYNVAIGNTSLYTANGANNNTAIGSISGFLVTTGSSCIFIGYSSGYNQTVLNNLLIIDNQQRVNAAAEITDSILYGVMAAAPANQTLRLNGRVGVRMTPTVAQLDVIQPDNAGAIPVASWEQTDIDQVLWKIIGTAAAASADRTLVADADFGTPGALVGWIQIEIQDDGNRVADADYWVPFHATPT